MWNLRNERHSSGVTIRRLARKEIYPVVLELVRSEAQGRKVLDIPAGKGALSSQLKEMGFEVTACDIATGDFAVPDVAITRADLNAVLPFGDASFDLITCVEGIEHLENPFNALREFARVLKPSGKLILTTPNYSHLERRLKFLFTGTFSKYVSQQELSERFAGSQALVHISPMTFTVLKFALESAGFRILGLRRDKKKRRTYLLLPLILIVWAYTRLASRVSRERYCLGENNSDFVFTGGNTLIILAGRS